MNLTIGIRSRYRVIPRVQVWVSWVEILMASSNIGSARSGRVGSGPISSREARPAVSIGGCNSRLRAPSVVISADLESTSNSGYMGYFRVCSGIFDRAYGSISVWAGQTHQIRPDPNSESPTLTETDP